MSAQQKRLLDQDPDYESVPLHAQQKRLKLQEQDAKEATIKTISQIIKTQFSQEISTREAELDTINQRIYEAQLLLDSLRVGIITKYYATGGKSLEQGPDGCPPVAQVHPTVKKYLGKCVPQLQQREDRFAAPKPEATRPPDVPALQQGKSSLPETNAVLNTPAIQGPRCKNKIRIIVGNVSKYIPSDKRDPNDHATHKWMVYVRCPPNGGPEIAQVVRKVRFFLHPSYRPNDLVVISEAPFHLVRKGWGEFPLRVQLHFCDRRNKPVDIIHNLKLDKTYTGLQTLGAETVVDLWMSPNRPQESPEERLTPSVEASSNHPVQENMKCSLPAPISDHMYSEPASAESTVKRPLQEDSGEFNVNPKSAVPKDIVVPIDSAKTETPANIKDDGVRPPQSCENKDKLVENTAKPLQSDGASIADASQTRLAVPATSSTGEVVASLPKPPASSTAGKSLLLLDNAATANAAPKNVANGARAQSFVKCTDSLGRVLLIPSTSLLRPKSAPLGPRESTLASSNRLPSILKNNVLRPILPRSSSCSAGPRMPAPTAALQRPPAPGPRFTLLVVPGADKEQSQILLVPTASLVNKVPTGKPSVVPRTCSVLKDCGTNKVVQQVHHSVPMTKKDPAAVLQKKLGSIRLCDCKDYSDALFAVAPLFPLTDVEADEKAACFPFASPSSATYFGWPLAKRRASEWLRASAVKKAMQALIEKQTPDWCSPQHIWSTKKTMLWCRRFGFTPLHAGAADVTSEDGGTSESVGPGGSYTSPKALLDGLEKQLPDRPSCGESQDDDDEEVDVEATDDDSARGTRASVVPGTSPVKSSQSPPRTQLPLSACAHFVRETAAEVGIHTSFVEVEPLVDGPVVEEMILAACKRFASTILRHSVNAAHERSVRSRNPDMVKVEDVYKVLLNLSECDFLTNSNLGAEVSHEGIDDTTHL